MIYILLSAVMCGAFNVPAKHIISCHSPSWSTANAARCITDLEKTINNCLKVADDAGIKVLAFPSVGSGRLVTAFRVVDGVIQK